MTKITLTNLVNLQNETTAVNAINNNSAVITTAFDNTLSRDGTAPNQMGASLDMNSNQIINLPQATNPTSPVRLQEVGDAAAQATAAAASAVTAATQAGISTAQAVISTTQAGISTTQAGNAAASATQAQGYITGLSGTSTTSLLIATGSKSFTTQTGKLWVAGQFVTASSNANSANYMHGSVTSYTGSTLVVNVLDIGGAGTLADWNITISGTQGSQGIQGNTGPSGAVGVTGTPTVNQFATWNNATTVQGVSITGLVKGNGASAPTAAVSNTDYQAPIGTISGIAKGNGANALTAAVANTDYLAVASPTFTGTLTGPVAVIAGSVSATGSDANFSAGGNRAFMDNAAGTVRMGSAQGGGSATSLGIFVNGSVIQQFDTGGLVSLNKSVSFPLATITDAANLVWTVSSGQKAKVTLGGNRTMNAVTGAIEGATYSLWVIQDATGTRTISWTTTGAGSFDFGTAGAPTLTTTLSKADLLTFEAVSIAGTLKLRFTGIMRGFS